MKRSIAVVAAGRGLTILWVFVTAQVMCQVIDEDSEVIKAIIENKAGLVTQMIYNKGLERASRQLHISPLREADINPTIGDGDDDGDGDGDGDGDDNKVTVATAAPVKEQKIHSRRRPRPRSAAYEAQELDNTAVVYGERPTEISQALPAFGNESPSTNYNGQGFERHPHRSQSAYKRPRGSQSQTEWL